MNKQNTIIKDALGGYIRSLLGKDSDSTTEGIRKIVKKSKLFDKKYYLINNADVRENNIDPLDHFIEFGGSEGRNPSENFNCALYLTRHSNIESLNPLIHYLKSDGYKGPKSPHIYGKEAKNKYFRGVVDAFKKDAPLSKAIIIMQSMGWDDVMQQRPHHLAKTLAKKGMTVIYIDTKKNTLTRKICKNIYLAHKQDVTHLIRKSKSKVYFWLFSTTPIDLKEVLKMKSSGIEVIYDYIDEIDSSISGDVTSHIQIYNNLNNVNPVLLIASADKLRNQLDIKCPETPIITIQNGVDAEHFSFRNSDINKKIPGDIRRVIKMNKKIVGYYGAMAPWLDYTLLNRLIKDRQDLNFVFIGIDFRGALKNLVIRDNVHFLGPINYEKLPYYSAHFDCAIIPFKKGEIAKSTSPVKLFEYMAMGLPTVCTEDLEECKGYDYVYVSKTYQDFYDNVDRAISDRKDITVRIKLLNQAEVNTWDARASIIVAQIEMIHRKGGPS